MKIEYSFSKYITDRTSLRLHAMMPNRGEAESQQPVRDNDTSVIRGPAIKKAGWLNSNGAVKHTAACEKSPISGVPRKSTEKPYFKKGCQNKAFVLFSVSFYP